MIDAPSRRDPNLVRFQVNERNVNWLGRIGAWDYGEYDGREYAVQPRASDPEGVVQREGQIMVTRATSEEIDGSTLVNHGTHLGFPVAVGTYAKAMAQRQARFHAAQRPRQFIDALRTNALLRTRVQRLDVAAIVALLAERGVQLRLTDDGRYLTASALGGRADAGTLALLRDAEPLLRAHLLGQPLRCARSHADGARDAVTLVEPSGMPVCAACADEEAPR